MSVVTTERRVLQSLCMTYLHELVRFLARLLDLNQGVYVSLDDSWQLRAEVAVHESEQREPNSAHACHHGRSLRLWCTGKASSAGRVVQANAMRGLRDARALHRRGEVGAYRGDLLGGLFPR
eukprot:COSAG02_NODE_123_length_35269_cov_51.697526_17_plen_122_part_00